MSHGKGSGGGARNPKSFSKSMYGKGGVTKNTSRGHTPTRMGYTPLKDVGKTE